MTLHLLVKRIPRLDPDMQPYLCNSKAGADLIRCRLPKGQSIDYYSDVGMQHSVHFSNTYLFYQHSWSGINIECGLAETSSKQVYHRFTESALNSFDANKYELNTGCLIKKLSPLKLRLNGSAHCWQPICRQVSRSIFSQM